VEITHPEIEAYLKGLLPQRHPVLLEMEEEARSSGFPIVGPLVGTLLALLTKTMGARRVLELGAGFGYSAFWFAQALPPDGQVLAFERNPANIERAKAYLGKAGLGERVAFQPGDALELLDNEAGPFDIIFNDIDKSAYPQVPPKALPKLRAGGLLVSDNNLWSGRVICEPEDDWTEGIQIYNRLVSSDSSLLTTIIPIRDGVAVSLKLPSD
jgi:caffeoyl-CoA O-methyltransferase